MNWVPLDIESGVNSPVSNISCIKQSKLFTRFLKTGKYLFVFGDGTVFVFKSVCQRRRSVKYVQPRVGTSAWEHGLHNLHRSEIYKLHVVG